MAYITNSKSKRLLSTFSAEVDSETIKQFHFYKTEIDFLNNGDKKTLYEQMMFFSQGFQSKNYIDAIQYQKELQSSIYVYPSSVDCYHLDSECEKLLSNYNNFRIPREIAERGKGEIESFRQYFASNHNYYASDLEKFGLEIQKRFNLKYNPIIPVSYPNSSVYISEKYTISVLEQRIDSLVSNSIFYQKSRGPVVEKLIDKYKRASFLAKSEEPLGETYGLGEFEAKEILGEYSRLFIEPVIFYLKNLLALKSGVDSGELDFDKKVLESLGFIQCNTCSNRPPTDKAHKGRTAKHFIDQLTKSDNYSLSLIPSKFYFKKEGIFNISFFLARIIRVENNDFKMDKRGRKYLEIRIEVINSSNSYSYPLARFYPLKSKSINMFGYYLSLVGISDKTNKEYYQVWDVTL